MFLLLSYVDRPFRQSFLEPIHHVIGVVDNSGVSHGVRYYDGTGTAIPHCLSRRDEQPEETDGVKVVALAGSVHATGEEPQNKWTNVEFDIPRHPVCP